MHQKIHQTTGRKSAIHLTGKTTINFHLLSLGRIIHVLKAWNKNILTAIWIRSTNFDIHANKKKKSNRISAQFLFGRTGYNVNFCKG
uniref:Uncharacterized protein n=1 Tax=Pyxicephalus adspersus TaxID=30357 RepID=A0AAV3AU45_PYXAD|nr:TPA: hypothetical protein GDO54_007275 [Pyxicephalus adspersus]